ncbi:putative pps1 dual specificty phosphatase protein [Eutypa lata UCREL1]|uniref:Putative pps1 dual specificty phosphatase protein n=1 Tax=Eutypa lata (strain UCR-EL1) TaxID=1287681 RepID=M7SZH6_EUTLA|nr:putative pps1 dual specificty phosphatase protein [Eutypa lata UCREL1]
MCRTHSQQTPPNVKYTRLELGSLTIFSIGARDVAKALDYISREPLPDPSLVFPWFHGLHPNNHIQQAFFIARRKALRKTPSCLRGVTVVKADGNLAVSRLKGAIAPDEFLQTDAADGQFIDIDPREGFSVRNFQIQAAKAAMTSDIIVYGDDASQVRKLGWEIAAAQAKRREKHEAQNHPIPEYNTFICLNSFREFEERHGDIVAVDSEGHLTGTVVDLFHQERAEMYAMSKASEISQNVWMGPTPEPAGEEEKDYDVLIECSDLSRLSPSALQAIAEAPDDEEIQNPYLEFPSSGSILPPTWSHAEADGILETCKWIWYLSHGTRPPKTDMDGDEEMSDILSESESESDRTPQEEEGESPPRRPRKILIHCADGYTESTMLGIAYFSYSTGRAVPEAWLHLHTTMKRNFFAYPTDVALLTSIAARLLHESPACAGRSLSEITALVREEPRWLAGLDGSFPSRVLDYMYLGNIGHANNPDLLRALGIRQILSVGETAMWRDGEREEWGDENVYVVQGVQDNGIDPLTEEFQNCLDFIERGRRNGTATLVHCRVGVSRSATICIAEVMRSLGLSLPRAYCFVRARRLNVIIQPHLRFIYELLKWEESLQRTNNYYSSSTNNNNKRRAENAGGFGGFGGGGGGLRRELEWGEIAREIALMNRPYAR